MPPPPQQQRSLPPLAWAGIIGGVALAFVLVALLAVQLAVLSDSRKHIAAQDAKITALLQGTRPALHEAGPAIRDARPLIRAAAPLARQARPLVREARASLSALTGAAPDLTSAARAVPPLLRTGQSLAAIGIPVLREIQAAALPRVVGGANVVIGTLLYRARLARALDATNALLEQIRSSGLIASAARSTRLAPVLVRLQRRLLRVQRSTLRVQASSRDIQAETLRVQRVALRHIESIDRKTGGQLPPVAPAGTQPPVP